MSQFHDYFHEWSQWKQHSRCESSSSKSRINSWTNFSNFSRESRLCQCSLSKSSRREVLPKESDSCQASLLVHQSDYHGYSTVDIEDADFEWNLSVYHGLLPILSSESTTMAKLYTSFSFLQWLLCQSSSNSWQAWQRILLDSSSWVWKHVWKRMLPQETKTF